jgi:hypothetical protein
MLIDIKAKLIMKKFIPFTLEEAQKPGAVIKCGLIQYHYIGYNKYSDRTNYYPVVLFNEKYGYKDCTVEGYSIDGTFTIEVEVAENVYKFGQKFTEGSGLIYMLCSVGFRLVNIININDGCRALGSPIEVENIGMDEVSSPELTQQIKALGLTLIDTVERIR